MSSKGILFLLPECAGYYTELCYKMGEMLKENGHSIFFAVTTPFYESFKKVNLSRIGKVYYLNNFLERKIEKGEYEDLDFNNWSYYASFSRQSYQFDKPLNGVDVFKRVKFFFQIILKENDVSLVISEGVSNSFLYLAYEQARANNIPYFGFMAARIPYHFNIHTDITGNMVLRNNQAPEEYLLPDAIPDYMKNSQFGGLFQRKYFLLTMSFYKEMIRFLFLRSFHSLEVGNTKSYLFKVYKIAIRRILSDIYYRKILKVYQADIKFQSAKVYVVYPLHFYPEASTSIMAKYYDGNEINLIKNLAFSLPENCILVVKEHKSNVGNNSLRFYKKIKQLPNVVLLDPYYNLKDNLENFDAVVTLTSTVGFEALTKKVPVYVLGEVFFQNYPGCEKVNSYFELEEKVKSLQKKQVSGSKNETFNLYSKMCFEGNFNYMSINCLNRENISLLLSPVNEYLKTSNLNIHRNN